MKWVIFSFSFLFLITAFLSPKEEGILKDLDKEELILLGESLFLDPILSKDQSISCASCHLPKFSFSDTVAFSTGVGGLTLRNTPTIINLAHRHEEFNWDGRFNSLETQILQAIQNPFEMGADLENLDQRLELPGYFPKNVVDALATFIRTLEYQDAKYDRVMRGEENFTLAEERG